MRKSWVSENIVRNSDAVLLPPSYPKRGNEVMRKLKAALDKVESQPGRQLALKQFGSLIGVPRSTIHDWYHGDLPAPIIHFLCSLERLSDDGRATLLGEICRDCPRLIHPRLKHDPGVVTALAGLLTEPSGLIFVLGPTAGLRTFLITALGNSVERMRPGATLSGLDVHRPDSIVPIPGVLYFRNFRATTEDKQIIRNIWKSLQETCSDIVLLNGVWNAMPELQTTIIALAETRRVIVADAIDPRSIPQTPGRSLSLTVIEDSPGEAASIKIAQVPSH